MRDVLSRLRAALTPQALLLLAMLLLLAAGMTGAGGSREAALERRLEQTLSGVDGAGRVRVTIREREVPVSGSSLSGSLRVPCGAVAVAQGADDPLVAMELRSALCALLGLPPSAVSIVAGGE